MIKEFIKTLKSGIRDNRNRGSVGEFLMEKILPGSKLLAVSAYFTIYAYEALKDHLNKIEHLHFLFGEPKFIKSLDPNKIDKKSFKIEDEGIALANRLEQNRVAKDCAEWIRQKGDVPGCEKVNPLTTILPGLCERRRRCTVYVYPAKTDTRNVSPALCRENSSIRSIVPFI